MILESWFLLLLIPERICTEGNYIRANSRQKYFEKAVLNATCRIECFGQGFNESCFNNCFKTPRQLKELDEGAEAGARLICRDVSDVVLAHNPGLYVIERYPVTDPALNGGTSIVNDGTRVKDDYLLHDSITTELLTWENAAYEIALSWKINISFTPSQDRVCVYQVRCRQDNGKYDEKIDLVDSTEFSVAFNGLPGAANFTIIVRAITKAWRWVTSNDNTRYAAETVTKFGTPRCVSHNFGFTNTFCAPGPVTGLNAMTSHKRGNKFDVHVTWDTLVTSDEDFPAINIQLTGAENQEPISKTFEEDEISTNETVFSEVEISDQYDVRITASNLVGVGPVVSRRFHIPRKDIKRIETTKTFHADVRIIDYLNIIRRYASCSMYNVNTLLLELLFESDMTVSLATIQSPHHYVAKTLAGSLSCMIVEWIVSMCMVGTILVVIGIVIAVHRRSRLRRQALIASLQNLQFDENEISPDRLLITRILGDGAFGVVKLGTLRDDQGNVTTVAVKMLRDDSNENDLRSFQLEIRIMKTLDPHPNIVSFLGCRTIGPYPVLVVEYCSRGDLLSFLRKSLKESTISEGEARKRTSFNRIWFPIRKKMVRENAAAVGGEDYVRATNIVSDQGKYTKYKEVRANLMGIGFRSIWSMLPYSVVMAQVPIATATATLMLDEDWDPCVIGETDMLNFGRQIATGMEFLSSSRIVHRDLAARNILVCRDLTVKISDFGLSRDVYQENLYRKWGNGRMPLKWMAIEALSHQVYSTYSDVWSFGVLLWEIVTLGGNPYPGMPTMEILKRLQSGYRMEKPENCSVSLYNVMLSCWQTKPKSRPSFTVLRQKLDELICLAAENKYLDINDVSEEILPEVPEASCAHLEDFPLQSRSEKNLELRSISEGQERGDHEVRNDTGSCEENSGAMRAPQS